MLRFYDARWTIWLTVCGAGVMVLLVAYFYAADHKELPIRVITTLNPFSRLLPLMTENWRPTTLNVRLYDGLLVLCMAAEGLVVGAIIDIASAVRHRHR